MRSTGRASTQARRPLACWTWCVCLLLGVCPSAAADPQRQPLNFLFIVCDDLNTHVQPTGYEPIVTPTLQALAAESMVCRRAYCQYPVCGPSRASFLSGLYPESTGVLDNQADIRSTRPGTVSLPQWLKDRGYWTASVGKVFHSPRHEPGRLAWNEFVRFENDELPVVRQAREEFEAQFGPIDQGANRRKWKEIERRIAAPLTAQTPPGHGPSGLSDAQHKDGKNARQVAQWLLDRSYGDRPFFIACGFQKPHVPFLAPGKYFDLYPADQIRYAPDPPDLWDTLPRSALSPRYKAFGFELGVENDALRREYMQAYHACVSFIDAQLAIVLDALKRSGHWNDTVIIFTSDHGYHLGDHFLWGKVTLFDIGTRVPLIIRVPGVTRAGSQTQAMVELVDIFPTVVDLAGLDRPSGLQGTSLRPLMLEPETASIREYAYTVVRRGQSLGRAVRNQHWRYAQWPDGEELYDLQRDPSERRNLAAAPRWNGTKEHLRQVLADLQQRAASATASK
ncbi:MAG: DUF4976 domain-containing protein [Planctomycetota bacterium]|nr:MAG: DUF4976 domain-containing protein [Planctomycetota bacterium]